MMAALNFSLIGGLIACVVAAIAILAFVSERRLHKRWRDIANEWRAGCVALDAEVKDRVADIMRLSDELETRKPVRGAGGRWISRRT